LRVLARETPAWIPADLRIGCRLAAEGVPIVRLVVIDFHPARIAMTHPNAAAGLNTSRSRGFNAPGPAWAWLLLSHVSDRLECAYSHARSTHGWEPLQMLRAFVVATILLTCADHWTTYVCLHAPVEGWSVSEANPVAQWLFGWAGLNGGLLIDSAITLGAVVFLATTHVFDRSVKIALFAIITLSTGYAVFNNLGALSRMGLAPWSGVA
jgi:hypothetical protein